MASTPSRGKYCGSMISVNVHPTTKLSVVNNSVYVGNSTKRLFRISADDGHLQSTLSVPASPAGRLLVDADALYIFVEDSDIQGGYLISTDLNLSHISWTRKADRAWSSEWPRLWNGLLLAGNCRSELDAFRISDGAPQWSDRLKGCLRSIGTDTDSEQIYVGDFSAKLMVLFSAHLSVLDSSMTFV